MSDAEAAARVAAGLDASRRVGWAKAYEAEEIAVFVTGYILALARLLRDGSTREARGSALRCLAKLQESPAGRSVMEKTLDQNGYLRDWLMEGMDQ